MTASELRELADDELATQLADNKEELFNLRFQIVTGQLDDPRRIRAVKTQIARVMTVMREREIAGQRAAVADSEE
ncbi:MAG TPA: 50S ribosomal protein L29 [Nitriliruptoraceae bacterium]|nr:50S ribosomal protein L29 [Nitriliruptoraceae bacterium]